MITYVNYELTDTISVADRGLAYGDGLFETILICHSQLIAWPAHFARLTLGCRRLQIPFSLSQQHKLASFVTVLAQQQTSDKVLKIIVTRGCGGRGYTPPVHADITVVVMLMPVPDYSLARQFGVALGVSPIPVSTNPWLSGLKHLNRLENVLAKQHLSVDHFDAIMQDGDGHVIECIQSNLFWFKQNQLFTPLLDRAGVQGTYRQQIIHSTRFTLVCGRFSLATLLEADEVFICNSLMGVVPVIAIKQQSFSIGENTRKLMHLL